MYILSDARLDMEIYISTDCHSTGKQKQGWFNPEFLTIYVFTKDQ